MDEAKISIAQKMRAEGHIYQDIADSLGVSVGTAHRYVSGKRYSSQFGNPCIECGKQTQTKTGLCQQCSAFNEMRTCLFCKEPYAAKTRMQQYCSPRCWYASAAGQESIEQYQVKRDNMPKQRKPHSEHRLNSTERGLGYAHQQARKRALDTFVDGMPCHYCMRPMHKWQALDLDHTVPRALGGIGSTTVLTHAKCNRRAGQHLSAALRKGRMQRIHTTRW